MIKEVETKEIGVLTQTLKREKGIRHILILVIFAMLFVMITTSSDVHIELKTFASPLEADGNYKISKDKASADYLKKTAKEIYQLSLVFSPLTVEDNYSALLLEMAPENYSVAKSFKLRQVEKVNKNNLSSVFYPNEYQINEGKQSVVIIGKLKTFSGDRPIIDEVRSYRIDFAVRNYRIHLLNFIDVTGSREPFDIAFE